MDYTASVCGKIFNRDNKIIKSVPNSHGYSYFNKCSGSKGSKLVSMHRFIWEFFNGEIPSDLHVDHINGVRDDNRLSNLQLLSRADNNRKGLATKLSWEIVDKIRSSKETQDVLGERYGVHRTTIGRIKSNRDWKEETRHE